MANCAGKTRLTLLFLTVLAGMLLIATAPRAASADSGLAAIAKPSAKPTPDLVQRVWQQIRLQALCESMVRNIIASVRSHPDVAKLDPQRRNRLIDRYEQFASAQRFENRLRAVLAATEPRALRAMMALTQSAIGRRAQIEEAQFQQAGPQALQRYRREFAHMDDAAERLSLIHRLDAAIGVTEMALRIAGASLYGTQVAIRAAHNASGSADVDTETIAQQARQFVHRMRPQQRHDVATTYLYLYRNLSLTELRDYVGRFESEPVRALQRSLIQALGAEMIAVQSDVIHELVADRPTPMAADI